MNKAITIIISTFVSVAHAGDFFSAANTAPTYSQSHELQSYVRTISASQPETPGLTQRLQQTVDYYKKVHILKTIYKKQHQYTIDCIPFAEQPSLIEHPERQQILFPSVIEMTHKNIKALKQIGAYFDVNAATECPLGSVAILRPSLLMLTSEQANQKKAPMQKNSSYRTQFHGGYSYQLGADGSGNLISIPTQANQAYFKGPQNQQVVSNNNSDHSLNQFWYVNDTYQSSGPVYSTEFGIIASAYFTTPASTSIFVFASIDNYGNQSCYNLECPNFVQFPNTPVLGSPTDTSVDYLFQVTHTTLTQYSNSPANYLTLVAHDASGTDSANSISMLLGYYSDDLYPSGHTPSYFSAGTEVYASEPSDGTVMYGNYMTPYVGYYGPLEIEATTENHNIFPFTTTTGPEPYGLIWRLGQ